MIKRRSGHNHTVFLHIFLHIFDYAVQCDFVRQGCALRKIWLLFPADRSMHCNSFLARFYRRITVRTALLLATLFYRPSVYHHLRCTTIITTITTDFATTTSTTSVTTRSTSTTTIIIINTTTCAATIIFIAPKSWRENLTHFLWHLIFILNYHKNVILHIDFSCVFILFYFAFITFLLFLLLLFFCFCYNILTWIK